MSCTEATSGEDDVKVKDTLGSEEVRHQLQMMVSGKLASRGISASVLWNTRPKTKDKLPKEEQERLERQRMNKRRWAQKDRARSKALLNDLRETNGKLEFENQQLKREVDRLLQKKHRLKSSLIDHQCQAVAPKRRVLRLVYWPFTHTRTLGTKGEDAIMEEDKADTKRSGLMCSPGSIEGKEDSNGHRVPHTLLHAAQGNLVGQLVVSSCQFQQKKIVSSTSDFQTVTKDTGNPGSSTEAPKPDPRPGSISVVEVKAETEHCMDPTQSQASGCAHVDEGEESLKSGGFSITELADAGKSFLQMLQEEDNGDFMIEDLKAASKKKRKYDEDNWHLSKSSPPQVKTEWDKSETSSTRGISRTPSSAFEQHVVRPGQDPEKRHLTRHLIWKPLLPTTANPYMSRALERQSDSSERGNKMDKNELSKGKQKSGNRHEPGFIQLMENTGSKSAKQMTRKGVLMERWFSQQSTKKHGKSVIPHNTQLKASKEILINPWAVGNVSEIEPKFVLSSGCSLDSAVLDLSKITVNIENDSNSDISSGPVMSSPLGMRLPLTLAASFAAANSSDIDVSGLCEHSTGSGVASTMNRNGVHASTASQDSMTADTDTASEVPTPEADLEDPCIPILTNEGHTLPRRFSWPSEELESWRSPVSRDRSLSLPSNVSGVIFEASDQLFFNSEQLPEEILPRADLGIDYLHTSMSEKISLTDSVLKNDPLNFVKDDMPATPSSPSSTPPSSPFGSHLLTGETHKSRMGRESRRREENQMTGNECGSERTEVMEDSPVKVETVPDADITTWQVLYEIPFVPEQMDTSWQPFNTV